MGNNITQITTLNGGLRVLTGYVPEEAEENYFVNVEIGSGSSDDIIDGQAHFLEHMVLSGIKTEKTDLYRASSTIAALQVDFLTDENRLGHLYSIDDVLKEIEAVTEEDIQELYRQSLSGNRVFVGMGPEGSFLPQEEFDQIIRLQEPVVGARLTEEFRPQRPG